MATETTKTNKPISKIGVPGITTPYDIAAVYDGANEKIEEKYLQKEGDTLSTTTLDGSLTLTEYGSIKYDYNNRGEYVLQGGVNEINSITIGSDNLKLYFQGDGLPRYFDGDTDSTILLGSMVGVENGLAPLDENGLIDQSYLPSYVDDVIEGVLSIDGKNFIPATHEDENNIKKKGKIYVDINTKKTYRWSGSEYVEISKSLVLGTGSDNAYYGDKGQTAYIHSQITSDNPHGVTKAHIGLDSITQNTNQVSIDRNLEVDGTIGTPNYEFRYNSSDECIEVFFI